MNRTIKTFLSDDRLDVERQANRYAEEHKLTIVSCSVSAYMNGYSRKIVLAVVYEKEERT